MIKTCLLIAAVLFTSSQVQAGVRLLWGGSLSYERNQEQVTSNESSTVLSLGYNFDSLPMALDLQWTEGKAQITEGGNLAVATQREEYMLWAKYFSSFVEERTLRAFGTLGAGQSRFDVAASIEDDGVRVSSKPQWQGGVGIGLEWRPGGWDFAVSPTLGYFFGPDRNPNPSLFTSVLLGLSF